MARGSLDAWSVWDSASWSGSPRTPGYRHLLLLERQTLPCSAGTLKSLGLARMETQIQHLEHIYQRLGGYQAVAPPSTTIVWPVM